MKNQFVILEGVEIIMVIIKVIKIVIIIIIVIIIYGRILAVNNGNCIDIKVLFSMGNFTFIPSIFDRFTDGYWLL